MSFDPSEQPGSGPTRAPPGLVIRLPLDGISGWCATPSSSCLEAATATWRPGTRAACPCRGGRRTRAARCRSLSRAGPVRPRHRAGRHWAAGPLLSARDRSPRRHRLRRPTLQPTLSGPLRKPPPSCRPVPRRLARHPGQPCLIPCSAGRRQPADPRACRTYRVFGYRAYGRAKIRRTAPIRSGCCLSAPCRSSHSPKDRSAASLARIHRFHGR